MKRALISFFLCLGLVDMASANNDLQLLQQLLDSEQLRGYWHIEQFPERSPLIVVMPESEHADQPCLTMFGKKVELTTTRPKNEIYFAVSKIRSENDKVFLEYAYPPEGLRGTATYRQSGDGPMLTEVQILEM